MTQTRDLIKKMADFFMGEEFYEKGEDARLELSPDDVRCMNYLIKQRNKALEQEPCEDAVHRQVVKEQMIKYGFHAPDMTVTEFVEGLPPVTSQLKYEDIAKAFQFGLAFGFGEKHDEMDKVIDELKKVITPQQKIGHWIDEGIYADGQNYHAFRCSECEWHYIGNKSELVDFKYCPFCRAKMEVEE